MIWEQVNQPVHFQSVVGKEPQETDWAKDNEEWIRESNQLSPNRHVDFMDALDVKNDGVLPPMQTLCHLDRPNISESRYELRRKPVPRLSDLVSSASVPRNLRDVVQKDALNYSPILGGEDFCQPCRVDPEKLPVPQEMRVYNLTLKKMLGVGGQGRVYLAQGPTKKWEQMSEREEYTQTIFAVKVMVKSRHASYDDILQEQRLLRRLRGNSFLLQLEASFHDRKNFYLITVSV
jgi:hypothetical protein